MTSFRVTGILPLVDAAGSETFPLRLSLDTPTADFTMAVLPDPGSALGGIAVVMALGWRRARLGP